MNQPEAFQNQRQDPRVTAMLPIQINIGSQVSLQGQLKDLSLKSAFVRIKASVYLQVNDQLEFEIPLSADSDGESILGSGSISRIAAGEGFAIYFTEMDAGSTKRLKALLFKMGAES
jgi:hypothetical protein